MSYFLADSTGPLAEFASIGGMADFREWAQTQASPVRQFVRDGYTEDLEELHAALKDVRAPSAVEEQRRLLSDFADEAQDILILSDGMSNEDEVTTLADWDESEHPRDKDGEFINKGGTPGEAKPKKKHVSHSKEMIAKAIEMKKQGYSSAKIQAETGLSATMQFHYSKKATGTVGGSKHTPEAIQKAWDMKQQGKSKEEIQKETGLGATMQGHYFAIIKEKFGAINDSIKVTKHAPVSTTPVAKPVTQTAPAAKQAPPVVSSTASAEVKAKAYGYTWQEKTYGPKKGQYAWFKDGIQQSAPIPLGPGAAESAATTMHFGKGPQPPPKEQELATAVGWPISNSTTRSLGSNYPYKVENAAQPWVKGLTSSERYAIQAYTNSAYASMNESLRSGHWTTEAKQIKSALDKAPTPPPPELVWRGTSGNEREILKKLAAGDEIRMDGFKSTSINPSFAAGWGDFLLEIIPKAGGYVRPISSHKGEYEYLLPHGKTYRVKGITKANFGTYSTNRLVIQLEMI